MTWTWQDALEHFLQEKQSTTTFEYLQTMAEQVEANRLAIEELRRSIQSLDSRTTGTTMIGGGE